MQNIDILNGKPFTDRTLSSTINRLDNETPSLVMIPYATWTNPTTTARTFIATTGYRSKEKLYVTLESLANLTSTISGIQTFTFTLTLGGETVATSVVTVPDALNTLFGVKLEGTISYVRNNAGVLEYVGNLIATPLATSATAAVTTITVVNTQSPIVDSDDIGLNYDVALTCTASVGTATTVITNLGGKLMLDNRN